VEQRSADRPPVAQRVVGAGGMRVSRTGLGTFTWGRDTDADEAAAQLVAFVDAGGTLVDSSPVYTEGAAQSVLGGLVGDLVPRSALVLSSTSGSVLDCSRTTMLAQLDATLAELGTDHLDLSAAGGPGTWVCGSTPAGRWPRSPPPSPRARWSPCRRSTRCSSVASRTSSSPPPCTTGWGCWRPCRWPEVCSPASTGPAPRPTPAAPARTWQRPWRGTAPRTPTGWWRRSSPPRTGWARPGPPRGGERDRRWPRRRTAHRGAGRRVPQPPGRDPGRPGRRQLDLSARPTSRPSPSRGG
jgi:hypothetical protein